MYKLKIGSHVSLTAPKYFEDSVKETLSYDANALMIYTGAPQNTIRKDIELLNIKSGLELLEKNNIPNEAVIVHAPYIINLCSNNESTRELAYNFLKKEIERTMAFKAKYLVLHPGCKLDQDLNTAIIQIANGINYALDSLETDVIICLETMAGKGSEVGSNFNELKLIIDRINKKNNVGVCLDTCHINDAGYDLNNFDNVLKEFDEIIGLNKLYVLHINDSKNPMGAHKDRHENIGYGFIGFDNLLKVIYHEKLNGIIKILETPYVLIDENSKKAIPPYKYEIAMIKEKVFHDYISELKK